MESAKWGLDSDDVFFGLCGRKKFVKPRLCYSTQIPVTEINKLAKNYFHQCRILPQILHPKHLQEPGTLTKALIWLKKNINPVSPASLSPYRHTDVTDNTHA